MSSRMKLPERRGQTVFMVEHNRLRFFVGVGEVVADAPVEVFVQAEKTTTEIEALARDGAILISFALQHGAGVAELASAMTRDDNGLPSTVIGAVLDAMARALPAPAPAEAEGA